MKLAFTPVALKNLFSKPSTVLYPFKAEVQAPPNYRGKLTYDPTKCVNCGMCVKVCSPGAINRIYEDVEGGQNITYEFDMSSCTFCATCQDFCSTGAIKMSDNFHMAEEDHENLMVRGSYFKKSVPGKLVRGDDCVFCGLCEKACPEGCIKVDRATKTWTWDDEECVRCEKCVQKCPKKCLEFKAGESGVQWSDACVYCTLCEKKCPVGAIKVDRANKTWEIDKDACIKCGTCVSVCPKKALTLND